jgi:hypothetical protein
VKCKVVCCWLVVGCTEEVNEIVVVVGWPAVVPVGGTRVGVVVWNGCCVIGIGFVVIGV